MSRGLPLIVAAIAALVLAVAAPPFTFSGQAAWPGFTLWAFVVVAVLVALGAWWSVARVQRRAREEQLAAEALASDAEGRTAEVSRQTGVLRGVIDAVPSPILATDRAGVVTLCNKAALEFFEGRSAVVGRELNHLFTHSEIVAAHSRALAGGSAEAQVRVHGPEGPRVCEVFVVADAAGAVLTLRDITQLATAVQLKTDFVANASHELRTPLASIRGAIETLADGAWEDEAMRRRLTGIVARNATRIEEMVRDLLDLSRLESPEAAVELADVRLADLVGTLRETFEPLAQERRVVLAFETGEAAETLRTDPKLLQLILKNLIDNAVKFAYADSTVRVVIQTAPGAARLRVIDRGIGIPLSLQPRIFERFYQVDAARAGGAARRGTGLGLAIVKHAVKALGGTIGVESVWKEGTTMTVEIPA